MSFENISLQTTHQIISLFDNAKRKSDDILDNLPLLFAVLTEDGSILKGNYVLSNLFDVELESLLDRNIFELLAPNCWDIFHEKINILSKGESDFIQFELSLKPLPSKKSDQDERIYLWNIYSFKYLSHQQAKIFSVIGKDISELQKALTNVAKLTKDIEISGAVQSLLIPQEKILRSPDIHLISSYQSASQSGGDWVWYDLNQNGDVIVMLGDVTGHDVGSAMVTAMVAGGYSLYRKIIDTEAHKDSLETIFLSISQMLRELCRNSYWMTLSALKIVPKDNKFKCWNAAGPPFFLMRSSSVIETISCQGTPIGSSDFQVGDGIYDFNSGDRLLLFTDGAYEIKTRPNVHYGLNGLRKLFSQTANKSLQDAANFLQYHFSILQDGHSPEDDITFVIIDKL